jgi:serine/threonine protein kinase
VSAVQHLHRNGVVHRDLKFENIRYNLKTGIVTLLDFGLASFYTRERVAVDDSFARLMLKTNCGSPCYAAPEIYESSLYHGPEIDIVRINRDLIDSVVSWRYVVCYADG